MICYPALRYHCNDQSHQWEAACSATAKAYGRNTGYYTACDTFRDIFERGGEKNWKKIIDLVRTDCRDVE